MNRFDQSFNEIDRDSGRPFSWGHPDGVWIIATVYFLIVLGTLVRAILALAMLKAGQPAAEAIVPLVGTAIMYVPPIVLLFLRKELALIWLTALSIFAVGAGVAGGMTLHKAGELNGAALVGMSSAVLAQVYMAYYAFGLRKDALLR